MLLRRELGGIDAARTLAAAVKITVASAVLAGVAWLVLGGLDGGVGRSLVGQILSVGSAIAVSGAVCLAIVHALGWTRSGAPKR